MSFVEVVDDVKDFISNVFSDVVDSFKVAPVNISGLGISYLIENLAKDIPLFLFLREFTQNAIEANAKIIVWGVAFVKNSQGEKIPKRSIIDDGHGMTKEVLYTNFKDYFNTSKSIVTNMGHGAKSSSATRNKRGIIIKSWVNGEGHYAVFGCDSNGNYGLKENENKEVIIPITKELVDRYDYLQKPEIIKEHGTQFIFLGNDENDITSLPSYCGLSGASSVCEYLSHRLFSVSEDLCIRVYDIDGKGHVTSENRKKGENFRRVRGLKYSLDTHSNVNERGIIHVLNEDKTPKVNFHYWVYTATDKASRTLKNSGHICLMSGNEIYELDSSKSIYANFGISSGIKKIFLVVEILDCTYNTQRTGLVYKDSRAVKLRDFAEDFKKNMPSVIKEIQNAFLKESIAEDSEALKKEIKEIYDLHTVLQDIKGEGCLFVESKKGNLPVIKNILGNVLVKNLNVEKGNIAKTRIKIKKLKTKEKKNRNNIKTSLDNGGVKKVIKVDNLDFSLAKQVWSCEDSDIAADYNHDTDTLRIFENYLGFKQLIHLTLKDYAVEDSDMITNKIKKQYALNLLEYVFVSKLQSSLVKNKDKDSSDRYIKYALSDEALTCNAGMRGGIMNNIRSELKRM